MATIKGKLEFEETIECLNQFAKYICDSYKRKLNEYKMDKPWNSMATGNLFNSVKAEIVDVSGREFEIEISLADYWKQLEEGQPAGTSVTQIDILNWIRAKHILPEERTDRTGKVYLPDENQLAFLIRRKIYREGTDPTWYMQYTIDEALSVFEVRLKEAMTDDVKEGIEMLIEQVVN